MHHSPLLRAALLLLALLLACQPANAQVPPSPGAAFDRTFGKVLDRAVTRGAPGAILAVDLPGYGLWSGARGVAERDGAAMTPGHRFRIASITKMFVAVVALQLVQEGWLSLDQTVEDWLPRVVLRGNTITVRQLLRHTSGLYDYMDGPFIRGVLANPQRTWQPAELVTYAVSHRPAFRPGAPGRWSYSNTNYVLLGMIVERVTGTTLAHEIHFRIVEPLGLANTGFEPDDGAQGLAHGYQRRRDLTALDMSFAWAAGNMFSNAADLARFARALFHSELLDAERMAEMTAFGVTQGTGWSPNLRYGLGLMQETLRAGDHGVIAYGHSGMLGGYRTALWYLPRHDITIVVMLNEHSANPATLVADALAGIQQLGGSEGRSPSEKIRGALWQPPQHPVRTRFQRS
jgi:D-alanyl-D-alanine carboxypeptidase